MALSRTNCLRTTGLIRSVELLSRISSPQNLLEANKLVQIPCLSLTIVKKKPISERRYKTPLKFLPKHPFMEPHIEHNPEEITKLLKEYKENEPVSTMPNPYAKPYKRCILCQHDVKLDYKNVQLLSQFVSPFTGQLLNRSITGLCIPMQKKVSRLVKTSRKLGLMPFMFKDRRYVEDPKLFDPLRPKKYDSYFSKLYNNLLEKMYS
ncbi:28S ribosomal protein S18b, mitochondrial isoform X1 [Octopus bimaculoides]|uniref:28S ribosomal protein S18b, mitochondrial n=2 Tax=Octopus bimaculoides TaxID=37653 RepID=A0A0L8G848_OCTBM|nr:28S ribosomal protein S18b, mitochondrial isoform X1 [Octopus bimaculoides]